MPAHGVQCPIADCTHPACVQARADRASEVHVTCTRCHGYLPVSDYPVRRASGTRQSWCRGCAASHARERRAASPRPARVRQGATHAQVTGDDRTFGVEIECAFTGHDSCYSWPCDHAREVQSALSDAGVRAMIGSYSTRASGTNDAGTFVIAPDCSVASGFEVKTCILQGSSGRSILRRAMRAIRAAGGDVNRSCGMHVHFGAGDLTGRQVSTFVRLWSAEQESIDTLLAPSRRGRQQYCGPFTLGEVQRIADELERAGDSPVRYMPDHDRYRNVNLQSYPVHGTIEVRQHQGSLNAGKALAWIDFVMACLRRAKSSPDADACDTLRALLDSLESAHGLDAEAVAFLEDRAVTFAGGWVST